MQRGLKPPLKHGPNVLHHYTKVVHGALIGTVGIMDIPDDVASSLEEVVEDLMFVSHNLLKLCDSS